ncbi:MAG: hypothetical protein OXN94_04760 [Chloroflexota bacterium]|nr:hypothetical protein [Chloroflexota bacterium]
MTVCIAALYGNGKGAVISSDHMITASIPMGYEFENEETSKIYQLSEKTFALLAGDVLFGNQIVLSSRAAVANTGQEYVGGIADIVKNAYKSFRLSHIVERYLEPRGLSLDSYYGNHLSLNPHVIQEVDQAFMNYHIGVEVLVVGPTGGGYGIHIIGNPGLSSCHDAIGFAAIGSGAPHVIYSLLGAKYKKSLECSEVEEMVKKAKEVSEVAPGVGKETTTECLNDEES